jgi:polyisoprenoid-binding protein YceI
MDLRNLATDPSAVGTWTYVPDRSSVRFSNKTMWGLIPVNGRFTDVSGQGRISGDGAVSGRLVIRAASVKTGIGMRDKHLQDADFFDVERFPEIVIEVTGAGAATLTVRGTTLPVPLTTSVTRSDDNTCTVTARGQIDRTRWGVSGNMAGMMPTTTTLVADAVFTKS